ncbi:uncharacterized protein B0P05DRAFT_570221 [Gilbertella persicaria]|uniref:Uncharacterized protein n=1 Tax=Rhizopus stolonifer TaxID=4846 RepID=A0A367KM80_RHIST|nr:uncharacterized protein B0P05DRAFT_570221 [Gilbertella persicaria]KAI8084255.1 hypothetical protein B0P05DRAFT_570221 [Gilbertella persicaria]RCI03269.1 hypothetical protein CU098_012474 [Rhizopus stolonifer]
MQSLKVCGSFYFIIFLTPDASKPTCLNYPLSSSEEDIALKNIKQTFGRTPAYTGLYEPEDDGLTRSPVLGTTVPKNNLPRINRRILTKKQKQSNISGFDCDNALNSITSFLKR